VWKAARYLSPDASAFGNIPLLVDGSREVHEDQDKSDLLLTAFFPVTPTIDPNIEPSQIPRSLIEDNPPLTAAEVGDAVERIRPWKAPGVDGIPHAAWKETMAGPEPVDSSHLQRFTPAQLRTRSVQSGPHLTTGETGGKSYIAVSGHGWHEFSGVLGSRRTCGLPAVGPGGSLIGEGWLH
jgi:hypothetical protein